MENRQWYLCCVYVLSDKHCSWSGGEVEVMILLDVWDFSEVREKERWPITCRHNLSVFSVNELRDIADC